MRKFGALPGCISGRINDKTLQSENKKTLLALPEAEKPQQQNEVIEHPLTDKEVIYELHFDDTRKNFKTVLPNGFKHIIEPQIKTLIPGAISQKISNTDDDVQEKEEEEKEKSNEEMPSGVIIYHLECGDDEIIFSNESDMRILTESERNDNSSSAPIINNSSHDFSHEPFSLKTLNKELKQTPIRLGWFYVNLSFPKVDAILFGDWNINCLATRKMMVKNDGSVEIFFLDRPVLIPQIEHVSSIHDIINNINIINNLAPCNGTGVNNKFSDKCKRFTEYDKSPAFRYTQNRCISCRKEKVQINRRKIREKQNADKQHLKMNEYKENIKKLMAENKKLEEKLSNQKEIIQYLSNKRSAAAPSADK